MEKKFAQQENGSVILSGILRHRAYPLSGGFQQVLTGAKNLNNHSDQENPFIPSFFYFCIHKFFKLK